jgi:two-component system osmolarity sensor histidine kinase EnvZ
MEHMIDAFLAFARDEMGEDRVPHDPRAVLRTVAEDAGRAGIDVIMVDRLPAGVAPVPLRLAAIRRALGNLLGNASTFADTVRLSAAVDGEHLCFSVEDDGPGIPEADREAALRPFTRLDAARNQNRASGVGLGLSIAADIAHAHGGTLRLETSAELGGLAARLCLPR